MFAKVRTSLAINIAPGLRHPKWFPKRLSVRFNPWSDILYH